MIRKLFKNQKGATAIEYALLAALIAFAGIASFTYVGNKVGSTLNKVGNSMV